MSSINNGVKQNSLNGVIKLEKSVYENIFNVNEVDSEKRYYFYNILNKVVIPDDLAPDVFEEITLDRKMSWTYFSFRLYGTMDLWWLIFLVNKPKYVFMAKGGQHYKYIKPEYVSRVISDISGQLTAK